jgi:AbiJ N-terminal domain 4
MRFSQRQALEPVSRVLQTNSMDEALRNRLWSIISIHCWGGPCGMLDIVSSDRTLHSLLISLWHNHFKQPIDTIPTYRSEAINNVRSYYFSCKWYQAYNLLEFIADEHPLKTVSDRIIADSNTVLEQELSGYRFVQGQLVPIAGESEIMAIDRALGETAAPFPYCAHHLEQAIFLLAQKPEADYRNSIKESISAVEALCAAVTSDPKATLGKALKAINAELHPALRAAFEKLYGYTSDGDGIRHALMEDDKLEQEDAVFMLVACSAFVSYVAAKLATRAKR